MNSFGFRPEDDTGAFFSIVLTFFVVGLVIISTLLAAVTRDAERRQVATIEAAP